MTSSSLALGREASTAQPIAAPFEKGTDRRVGLQSDRPLISLPGGSLAAVAGQELGAGGPIGLVFDEPRIIFERVERGESGGGSLGLHDRNRAVDRHHG